MYKTDARTIAHFAKESPINTFLVGRFVIATVQRHLEKVPNVLTHLGHGNMRDFSRSQQQGLQELWQKRNETYEIMHNAGEIECLLYLARLRGYALVKAGFYAQLCRYGGNLACFDTHNIQIYGLNLNALSRKPTMKSEAHNRTLVESYRDLCIMHGGAEKLWNTWCQYVAKKRPKVWQDAEHVSRFHVDCIIREEM